MNKQIIVGVIVAVIIIGVGGWFYFSPKSQLQEPAVVEKVQETTKAEPATKTEAPKELTKTEQATARSFAEKVLKLIQNRDYGKVYDLLTNEDKAAESKTDFVKRLTEAFEVTTITSWQIKEVLEEQDGASVQYVSNYTNPVLGSGSETGILTLAQRNGKWFLSSGAIDVSKAVVKGVGDEIVLATIKFKVNAVSERNTISSSNPYNQPLNAREGAKFVVVDMSITNLTKANTTFPSDAFTLVDNQDRQFTPIIAIGHIDNYLDGRNLSPSISERGVIVYEIPTDATGYWFLVAKAGTSEAYKVILK